MTQLLDGGAAVDQTMVDGATPLYIAYANGHVDAARLLLDKGADVDQSRNGVTLLFLACQNGHVDAMRLLLDNGAEVDRAFIAPHASASSYAPYATPLFIACQKGHVDAARLLLQRGAVFAHDSSALGVGDRV